MKCSKRLSVTMPWGVHKLLSGPLGSKRRETSVEDSERPGRPSTGHTDENVENVRKIINEDRWNTITEIAGRLGLSYGTWQLILTEDLNMQQISGAHNFVCAAIFGR
jgi:hypothetical protein